MLLGMRGIYTPVTQLVIVVGTLEHPPLLPGHELFDGIPVLDTSACLPTTLTAGIGTEKGYWSSVLP